MSNHLPSIAVTSDDDSVMVCVRVVPFCDAVNERCDQGADDAKRA